MPRPSSLLLELVFGRRAPDRRTVAAGDGEAVPVFRRIRLAAFLLAFAAWIAAPPASADDDNGESIALVVRAADDLRCTAKNCGSQILNGIYFGSRMECVFALDPREPFANDGGAPGAPLDWESCKELGDCFWGYPNPADGSCIGCEGTLTTFHPVKDRIRWRHPTKEDVIASATLATCDPPPGEIFFDDPNDTGVEPRPATNYCVFIGTTDNYFLALDEDPALPPVDRDDVTDCLDAGGDGLEFLDEPPFASCLWQFKTDNQIWRNAIAPSQQLCPGEGTEPHGHVLVASKSGYLAKFDRHPRRSQSMDCNGNTPVTCDSDNPLSCPLAVLEWDPEVRIDENSLEIRGGLVAVRDDGGGEMCVDDSRLLIAATSEGVRSVKVDVAGPTVTYNAVKLDELFNETTSEHEKFERYGIQGIDAAGYPTNRFYFGFGASANDQSGLAAFDVDADGDLTQAWRFKRGAPVCGDRNGCAGADSEGVQLHRTTPVVSHDGAHVFATNRHASGADLSGALLAFAKNPIVAPTPPCNPTGTADLVACAFPSSGDGIVAAPAQATVPCKKDLDSDCCVGETAMSTKVFDRIIVLSKAQKVFVYDFCDGQFHPAVDVEPAPSGDGEADPIDWPGGDFAELRAQPVVAEEVGTYYFQDNNPDGERFFAFDLYQPEKLKWVYETNNELQENSDFCKIGVPAGGRDCYPAPIPWVYAATSSGGGVALTVCPHHVTRPSINELANANCSKFRVAGEVTQEGPSCTHPVELVDVDRSWGVQWRRLDDAASGSLPENTTPPSGHGPCFSGTIPTSAFSGTSGSPNDFVLTARTRFGKEGGTQITLEKP